MGANEAIKIALNSLNPEDDTLWTNDGLPRMDVVEGLLNDKAITRKQVTEADPEFCRDTAKVRCEKPKENENDIHPEVQAGNQEETQAPQIDPEEQLRAHIMELDEAIRKLSEERTKLDQEIHKLQLYRDRLQTESHTSHSAKEDMKARMRYIQSQNEARAKRYEKGRKILQIIGKDGLNPKSKLDQAMSRKRQRGTKRPPPRLMTL